MHQPEHTPRTLFVDDESINQQIGAEILLALGAEADTADNGLQALRLIRTRHYAIVFTDVEMPVMDGATLTHILRSDSRYGELPIIACTAISSPEEEEALLQKGFTAVLRKPFDVQAMQTALNRHATLSGEAPAPSPDPRPRVEAGHAIREELEHLPGFSVRQGLDRVMGNLPLYVSLLFDFRRELAEADAEIRQARLRDDMPSIRASVHKLKHQRQRRRNGSVYAACGSSSACKGVPQKMSATFLTPYTATLQRPRVSLRRQGRPSPRTPKPL